MNLIERIEGAEGPSRELDAEIFIAVCWPDWRIQTDCEKFPEQVQSGRIQEPNGCGWRNAPAYTASLDAAMSLVPEGWHWTVNDFGDHASAYLINAAHEMARPHKQFQATPALALCAAALRAIGDTHDD